MTAHVQVLSLWRGVLSVRMPLARLAADRGDDVQALRARGRRPAEVARYLAFVEAAVGLGASHSEVARFLRRDRSTISTIVRRRRAEKVSS